MTHVNIPFFVPHLGCPHTCVFCNQRTITGIKNATLEDFDKAVKEVLSSLSAKDCEKQIAFFGGSFTAIEREIMLSLLEGAYAYVKRGEVSSVRLSTRPDAIDDEVLTVLKHFGVSTVELGIQSTDQEVLEASERGHTAEDSRRACERIKAHGFTLVGQMMLGLPSSTEEKEIKTATDLVRWGVDEVRIYPTVVFKDTALAHAMEQGCYLPLSVEEAVSRAASVYEIFSENGIRVIRVGLCETDGLRGDTTVGGAYHPALGELVISRLYLRKIQRLLRDVSVSSHSTLTIQVSTKSLSKAIGQKKCNLITLQKDYGSHRIRFEASPELSGDDVKILIKEN